MGGTWPKYKLVHFTACKTKNDFTKQASLMQGQVAIYSQSYKTFGCLFTKNRLGHFRVTDKNVCNYEMV
jgi:hypothetical protein